MNRDSTAKNEPPANPQELVPIRIGVSSCLLGEQVRYDRGHKHDRFLSETLGAYFEWVPVCPEVELGLGVPRPTLRLERREGEVRLLMPAAERDYTAAMRRYARRRARELDEKDLRGFVLKSRSPSCGMERVTVYEQGKRGERIGRGLFAEALLDRFPNLPIEEEGRLQDPRLRENWITRVFAYHRLRALWKPSWSVGRLVAFHTAHKYLLLAHSQKDYRELGRLVAEGPRIDRRELQARYESQFMSALKHIATPARHTNVLQHLLGFFRRELDAASREELQLHVEDYRRGRTPLVVPLTLIAHYVRVLDVEYLRGQVYLQPHPRELALRNHV